MSARTSGPETRFDGANDNYRSVNFEVVVAVPRPDRLPTAEEIHSLLWKHLRDVDGEDAIKVVEL